MNTPSPSQGRQPSLFESLEDRCLLSTGILVAKHPARPSSHRKGLIVNLAHSGRGPVHTIPSSDNSYTSVIAGARPRYDNSYAAFAVGAGSRGDDSYLFLFPF